MSEGGVSGARSEEVPRFEMPVGEELRAGCVAHYNQPVSVVVY